MTSRTPYRLRSFSPQDPGEIERMNLMFYHPHVMKYMGFDAREYRPTAHGELQRADRTMFSTSSAVSRKHTDVAYAVADAHNNLVGWIWFCVDRRHPFPKRVARRLDLPRTSRIYQVVYEKLLSEGWPEELFAKVIHVHPTELFAPRRGVIVEWLRLAIARLKRSYRKLYATPRTLVFYAFVLPDNFASQKVLLRNGFVKEERQYWCDGVQHELWVRVH